MPATPKRNLELETAALANFDDLDSWRVFADALLSEGDQRGEIVSLTMHLGDAFASERKAMTARIRELERPLIEAWHQSAHDHDLLGVEAEFKRGFVHAIKGPLLQLRPRIDALFERDPIQRLTLTEVEPDAFVSLCESNPPWLSRLRYLKIVGELGESGAAALASVPLANLRRLNLLGTGLDDRACVHLAELQTQTLERLVLTANAIEDQGLRALLDSPTRGQWRELFLTDNPIGGEAIAQLGANPGLDALTGLYLRGIEAGFADFAVFANASVLPALTRLELSAGGSWRHGELIQQLRERFGAGLRLR